MAGRAVTAAGHGDLMSVIAALEIGGAGDVLVVSAGDRRSGGVGRAVRDGGVPSPDGRRGHRRHVTRLRCAETARLAVLLRGVTPKAPPAVKVPEIQVPLTIGDVEVHPGDILVGDDDGIIVGTAAEFEAIVDAAEAIQTREKALRISIEGRPLTVRHAQLHRAPQTD